MVSLAWHITDVQLASQVTFGARSLATTSFGVITATALLANRLYSVAYGTNLIRTINLAVERQGGAAGEAVSERPASQPVNGAVADHADSATICHTI